MAQMILLLGNSGTGKSTSMRNLPPDDVCLINISNKPLPFRNKFTENVYTADYKKIIDTMNKTEKTIIIIDDFQYLLSTEFFNTIDEKGYDKYNRLAYHYFKVIDNAIKLDNNKIVVFTSHIDRADNGNEKIKTIGKLLDDKLCVEGLFTTVLGTLVQDGSYYFTTKNNGSNTVKTPMGMFESEVIDNDLNYVIEKVKEYYGMNDAKSAEELSKIDEEKKAPIELPRKRKRPTLDNGVPF